MLKFVVALVTVWTMLGAPAFSAAATADRTVRDVQFAKGGTTAVLKGTITGYNSMDYRLRAGAGQILQVSMHGSNGANYFNVLPPDSQDAAMFVSGAGKRVFDSLLPADGTYTLRVYLMRSAARRGESSHFTLSVSINGMPLLPLSPRTDALIPGTPFHAQTTVTCEPAYSKQRNCEALVTRRGTDGTATVELRWDKGQKRRILFVKGRPEVADVPQPFTFTRDAKGYVVNFGGEERFEIPEALVFGG